MAQINKPNQYFNTKLYTGNGSTQSVTGVGFQPDFVWLKNRSAVAGHQLSDAVREKSGTNYYSLSSDTTAAQAVQGDNDGLNTLGSDGFTVGYTNSTGWNNSGNNYASWNWKAGTSVSGNTGGSGTAKSYSGSVNTDAGFSITSFTGNGTINHTIPHSLNAIPSMFIIKKYGGSGDSTARDWNVYNQSLGNTKVIFLNTTAATSTSSEYWNNTTPTSSVINLGANDQINGNNNTYICYAFAEKQGYSKFGSYTGNGNADGTFVYTGQKSAFIMLKNTTRAASWLMFDNKRLGYNVDNNEVVANTNAAEETYDQLDFLSNGFKMRTNGTSINLNGDTYIYMAFAENPLVGTNNIPATAR